VRLDVIGLTPPLLDRANIHFYGKVWKMIRRVFENLSM
jgi:hypothetical protein